VHDSGFGYRWDGCEHWSVLSTGVTSAGNLGALLCLDIV
jgi:hypothetical protein